MLVERAASISQSSAGALLLPPAAEYAMLRLQLEHISNDATAALPAAASLLRDKYLERLTPGSSVAAKVSRMEKLERLFPDSIYVWLSLLSRFQATPGPVNIPLDTHGCNTAAETGKEERAHIYRVRRERRVAKHD